MVKFNQLSQIQAARQRVGEVLSEIDALDLASAPRLRVALLAERWQVMAVGFADQLLAASREQEIYKVTEGGAV